MSSGFHPEGRSELFGTPAFLGQSALRGTPIFDFRATLRRRGAITNVIVMPPSSVVAALKKSGKPIPKARTIPAMIDTGASITAIDEAVARSIGLTQTGSTTVAGVTGVSQRPIFGAELRLSEPVRVKWDPAQIVGVLLGNPSFSMLIGRDLLSDLALNYQGKQGKFSLIF